MEGVGMGVSALKGALDTQADLATRVLGGGAASAQSPAASGDGAALRAAADQERGVGRSLNIQV